MAISKHSSHIKEAEVAIAPAAISEAEGPEAANTKH